MQDNKQEEIRQLVEKLNTASDAYYNGKGEMMSDHEWDAAFDRLKQLEKETGTVLPDSPTENVGADKLAGQKEEHEFPTLSLAKTKNVSELAKWADGRPIWLSWKLDGLTLVATYDNGSLAKVVTRGNGHTGTNITHLAPAISGIPPKIKNTGHVVIRGEAVISYPDFERFNIENEEEYANPRNLASGSLTLKDINEVRARHIRWIPFTLVYTDEEIVSWGRRMDFLKENGFTPVDHELIGQPTADNIGRVIEQWTLLVTGENRRQRFPYPVDGLVISYDDTEFAATGSVTGHHATRAGYAFKWQDESAETELDHIEWSCAASTISPVAVFRPVELEGTTVKRASLCNISECERLGIGGKGTRISVIKANKIIPKVVSVTERIGELHIPESCPVCNAPTEITESESSMTKTLHCTNANCPAKQLKKFARFVSKEGVNVDGFSEQTLQKFINLGWVSEYADIFHLSEHAAELRHIEGFGDKSVRNLLASIENARNVEAHKLLFALNIPEMGQDACKRILSVFPLEKLMESFSYGSSPKSGTAVETSLFAEEASSSAPKSRIREQLSAIPGIGPVTSSRLADWMQDPRNYAILTRLMAELKVTQPSNEAKGAKCEGLTFVVTGDVHHYKNRNELKKYIESQGGKVTGSVSKATNYLINNDAESTSGKNQKAHALSIPIISEEEFIRQFAQIAEE
ncbi:NAD-dependent DNA ligase LigA [Prevotella dentasini]